MDSLKSHGDGFETLMTAYALYGDRLQTNRYSSTACWQTNDKGWGRGHLR